MSAKKGQGSIRYDDLEQKKQFATHIVVTSDLHTRYIFRSDVAYDWFVNMDDIERDTALYKDDHLNEFVQKKRKAQIFLCSAAADKQRHAN